MELRKIEYRVREIPRFVVTSYIEADTQAGSREHGTFDSPETAFEVAYALCRAKHDELGWPTGDERITYPQRVHSFG